VDELEQAQYSEWMRQELLHVIPGAGAFRMLGTTIRELGRKQSWSKFRKEALPEIARDWLEEHKLP